MKDDGSLDSSSFKAFQNKSLRLDAFVCYVLAVKKMKFKTNLVFWIFMVVVYISMNSHKDKIVTKFRIPTTKHFLKEGSVKLSNG